MRVIVGLTTGNKLLKFFTLIYLLFSNLLYSTFEFRQMHSSLVSLWFGLVYVCCPPMTVWSYNECGSMGDAHISISFLHRIRHLDFALALRLRNYSTHVGGRTETTSNLDSPLWFLGQLSLPSSATHYKHGSPILYCKNSADIHEIWPLLLTAIAASWSSEWSCCIVCIVSYRIVTNLFTSSLWIHLTIDNLLFNLFSDIFRRGHYWFIVRRIEFHIKDRSGD